MKYVIPALLAFLTGLLLWQIQRERVALDYEVVASDPFPREEGTGQYFVVRLRNSGSKQIERIALAISLESGNIESVSFSNPDLIRDVAREPRVVRGFLPLLNPAETFSTTITSRRGTQSASPTVVARAPGATATPRTDNAISGQLLSLAVAALVAALATAAVSFYTSLRSSKIAESLSTIENLGEVSERIERTEEDFRTRLQQEREELDKRLEERRREHEEQMRLREEERKRDEQGEPRTEQVVFAIFNRAGLSHRFAELVGSAERLAFWKTGLFLMNSFLVDEPNRDRYVSAGQMLLELPGMAPSSLGFNLYLLAKMEQFRGNSEKAVYWLQQCRERTPLMYQHLMGQDPVYDLESVRQAMFHQEAN